MNHSQEGAVHSLAMTDTWATYRAHGLTIASDFAFTGLQPVETSDPDVTITALADAGPPEPEQDLSLIFASRDRNEAGGSMGYLYRGSDCDVIQLTGIAEFYICRKRIEYRLHDPCYAPGVEVYLLGAVLSFWLERRGVPALHASAVSVAGRAVAFLASNDGGKTSLAAALMQKGYPLLTDDVLPLDTLAEEILALPGYPQLRMWPEQAAHFAGPATLLERVHPQLEKLRVPVGPGGFGAFCSASQPLACLYLPVRRDFLEQGASVRIEALTGLEAVKELVRHSFVPHFVEAYGLQPHRLAFFGRLVRHVPMRRVHYASGFDYLPEVADAILEDVESSGTA